MPVSRNYTGGSIVYFAEDKPTDEIYVLQQGRVILISTALDTGDEIKEEVQIGEFFGVKSTLGKYPREETAQILGKSTVLVFKVNEFEAMVMRNTRIVMKMLKVFSRNLRNIHRQVRDILKAGAQRSPAYELMNVAESFYRTGNFDHAVYALERYLHYYPGGRYTDRAHDLLSKARKGQMYPPSYPPLEEDITDHPRAPANFLETSMQTVSNDYDPFALDMPAAPARQSGAGGELETMSKKAAEAFSRKDFAGALRFYTDCVHFPEVLSPRDEKIVAEARFERGRTLLELSKFDEANLAFSEYIKMHPTGGHVKSSLFHMGLVAEKTGNRERAKTLYSKVVSMLPPDELSTQARKKVQEL
ncbi:MAG: cyclic nucleotide-binding domain-containing protein [Spirochaetales bacterium]|nr:cyclic nucleotide-binding domain-containing protein [Spirochaetales bacterium]